MAAIEGSDCGLEGGAGGGRCSKRVVHFDRDSKLDELAREMDRLQEEIEGLQKGFQNEEKKKDDAAAGEDPICFTCMEYKKGAALFPCGHTFCWRCTSRLRRGQGPCPYCFKRFWTAVPSSLL
ncbi:hypothetical protein R1flu_022174 [Riccia fluitans]|uniref:RING-type domain-containing protein n=1 Tax=Riccia fluitans TaxID=41844 RepID=A0ABD1ZRF3_9MARC